MRDQAATVYQTQLQAVRQLRVELESCEKKLRVAERKGDEGKQDANMLFLEILSRKEKLKALASIAYEPIFDANKISKKALQGLFQALDGFAWVQRFGWVGQSKTPTREEIDPFMVSAVLFDGVQVEKAEEGGVEFTKVRTLGLSGYGTRGALPEVFGQLELLESVDLSFNIISGAVPKTLKALYLVREVDLSANLLSGGLDSAVLEGLTNVVTLNLSFNSMSGALPDSFAQLVHLERLDLSGNDFSGNLPASLGNLARLVELRLSNNKFSGDLPASFSKLTNLRHVNLSQNQLVTGLNAFNQCPRLERLLLQHNHLTDAIDPTIAQLKRLRILYLHNNYISGFIPEELCQLGRLQHLNLSDNQLRGCLPARLGQLRQLETLLLQGNLLVGPVPLAVKELTRLRDFFVFRPYPAEFSMEPRAFSRQYFERVYVVGPAAGINSMHWDFKDVYGRERAPDDDQTVTLFSGTL